MNFLIVVFQSHSGSVYFYLSIACVISVVYLSIDKRFIQFTYLTVHLRSRMIYSFMTIRLYVFYDIKNFNSEICQKWCVCVFLLRRFARYGESLYLHTLDRARNIFWITASGASNRCKNRIMNATLYICMIICIILCSRRHKWRHKYVDCLFYDTRIWIS
jgi:hypothetical protein